MFSHFIKIKMISFQLFFHKYMCYYNKNNHVDFDFDDFDIDKNQRNEVEIIFETNEIKRKI